jgi:hypothetical protein
MMLTGNIEELVEKTSRNNTLSSTNPTWGGNLGANSDLSSEKTATNRLSHDAVRVKLYITPVVGMLGVIYLIVTRCHEYTG